MGAGKTTVGKELAQQLGCAFTDLDQAIERFERASVAEIFTRSGQAAFRHSESETLKRFLGEHHDEHHHHVLAIGGGAYSKRENQEVLQASHATTVFLSAPVDELWQRVSGQPDVERPLMRDRASFSDLWKSRMPQFAMANLTVETAGRDVKDIAAEIRTRLGL